MSPLDATIKWIEQWVVGHNLCPFAQSPYIHNRIRFSIFDDPDPSLSLALTLDEIHTLDENPDIQTTLIVFGKHPLSFEDYLELFDNAENLITECGYQAHYQIASFHPDYCFANEAPADPSNYSNRSPYPMFHLLRSDDVYRARLSHPDIDSIPNRNIDYLRHLFKTDPDQFS